jgi:hypothetical protein
MSAMWARTTAAKATASADLPAVGERDGRGGEDQELDGEAERLGQRGRRSRARTEGRAAAR